MIWTNRTTSFDAFINHQSHCNSYTNMTYHLQYGSISSLNNSDIFSSSPSDLLDEEILLHSSCTQCAANFRHCDYDCSICLERLQDPVWCGQGNCSMRSCRKCLITWCETKHSYKCPHCQIVITKSKIKSDDELQRKMEEEQKQYPYVVRKVKEQCCVISLQQKQITAMSERIQSIELDKVRIHQEKMIAILAAFLFGILWLCSFWSVANSDKR